MIEKSVIKVGLNVKKMPLGKLSVATLKQGLQVLKDIEKELGNKKVNKENLNKLSSDFYRYIPHDFKFQNMSNFIINSEEKLKEKLQLIDTLGDIRITAEINDEVNKCDSNANQLDSKYSKMKCKIEPLTPKEKIYKPLAESITSSGGQNITILKTYQITRDGENKKFKSNLGNRKLLWHGSGFSNWGGILSQGLRIAPPEAP
jgi:poly [ADP-ribose] polymerase